MSVGNELLSLILLAAERGTLRKLVLTQPTEGAPAPRQSGKLCLHRGTRTLVLEASYEGGRVSQKLLRPDEIEAHLAPLMTAYRQIHLLTAVGDAEQKISRRGKTTLLGGARLRAALSGEVVGLSVADMPLDREKKHILSGNEPFLAALGITGKDGRVHDKRQAKFRQINRFLEHLEGVYSHLPSEGALLVYDLCCGKSYLSFAVYHYLRELRGREVRMVCVDLRRDILDDCKRIADACNFAGMEFLVGDVRTVVPSLTPDLIISLHACDVATDIVLARAATLGARVILSTPCCHRYLGERISSPALDFVTRHPQLRTKLCDALTDGLRLLRLESEGYTVTAAELTDPENTPKNTILRAIRRRDFIPTSPEAKEKAAAYRAALCFLLGDEGADRYLEGL